MGKNLKRLEVGLEMNLEARMLEKHYYVNIESSTQVPKLVTEGRAICQGLKSSIKRSLCWNRQDLEMPQVWEVLRVAWKMKKAV